MNNNKDKINKIKDIIDKVDTSALMMRSLVEWQQYLIEDCQVYVYNDTYLAKRFDQINYKFCNKNEAFEILIDNLFALLRFKYFTKRTEEIDERIKKIVGSFTTNLKTTLLKVSFDKHADCRVVNMLPDYCIAFRNGVFNFKDNQWLFKYEIHEVEKLMTKMYLYDSKYVITWYLDYIFEPMNIDVSKMNTSQMISYFKKNKDINKNYCFKLLYNMSHDYLHEFQLDKFNHLCQILGYTLLQSFSQHFVMIIGSGQNGKNSLFDGCLTNKFVPSVTSNDLDSIENDRFITGALENKCLNIFLETTAKTYKDSKMIKALTGSMYQTIEQKGINKYSGIINCKYVFAGNDQENIKFSDTTVGFTRRINVFEIFYRWDKNKKFLKLGDYYDTTFSDSLVELKSNILNTTTYVYFAMMGLKIATNNFTSNFQFTYNDWKTKYSYFDEELKSVLDNISCKDIAIALKSNKSLKIADVAFYSESKKKLYSDYSLKSLGFETLDDLILLFKDDELSTYYFDNHDVYISTKFLYIVSKTTMSAISFTKQLKQIYHLDTNENFTMNNMLYIRCTFDKGNLKIIK